MPGKESLTLRGSQDSAHFEGRRESVARGELVEAWWSGQGYLSSDPEQKVLFVTDHLLYDPIDMPTPPLKESLLGCRLAESRDNLYFFFPLRARGATIVQTLTDAVIEKLKSPPDQMPVILSVLQVETVKRLGLDVDRKFEIYDPRTAQAPALTIQARKSYNTQA